MSVLSLPQKEVYEEGQGSFIKKKSQLNKKEQKLRHSEAIIIFLSCGGIDPKLRVYTLQKHME